MSGTFVVREGKWVLLSYPFLVLLVACCIFFVVWFLKGLGLVRDRRVLADLAVEDGKAFAVNVSVYFSVFLRLAALVAAVLCLLISFKAAFDGFISLEVANGKVVLNYAWPKADMEIPGESVKNIQPRKWGQNLQILEITTVSGRRFRSAAADADTIRVLLEELKHSLGFRPD